MTLLTKPNNKEITGFTRFIVLYCNLLRKHFYVSTLCMVAVGRSAYEHLRHIQVSPTYKQQTKDNFHTCPYLSFDGFFAVLFNKALNS